MSEKYEYLNDEESALVETAKEREKLERELDELEKAKSVVSEKRGKVSLGFYKSKRKSNPYRRQTIFNMSPPKQDFTSEQKMLRSLFGGGGKVLSNFDGRSLPRLNKLLVSGGGLIKNGDFEKETARIFGLRR